MKEKLLNLVKKFFPNLTSIEEKNHKVDSILSWAKENDCHIIETSKLSLPALEGHLKPILFLKGNENLLLEKAISIVGTRRPSPYGIFSAHYFSRELSRFGYVIISGLALGIDTFAHQGTLKNRGKTIAMLGHGLDRIYPSQNYQLAESILKMGGALISEYPPQVPPNKYHFPERNRLISLFSAGTLVIEAPEKSGSLITAQFALDQNREVFVVPGPFNDANFIGSHRLIQEGAKLVRHVSDMLEELPQNGSFVNQSTEKCHSLEMIFRNNHRFLDLSDLESQFVGSRSDFFRELDRGIDEGMIEEVLPQHFLWVGPT